MATPINIKKHQREVARIQRQLHAVNRAAVGEALVAIKASRIELRDELERIILRHGSTSVQAAHIRELLDATDLVTARLNARLRQGIEQHVRGMMGMGAERLPAELSAAGLRIELPGLDPLHVQFAQQYSMSLVQGVSASARQQLHGVMFRAAMGQQTPWEAQLEIGRVLETDPRRTHWGSIASQAERIYRSEGLRASNLSHAERMKQSSTFLPGATKMWLHGGGGKDPRPEHRALHGKTVPVNSDFEWADKKGLKYKAFGPHDSRLPASQVVNCTCTVVLIPAGANEYDATIGNRLADRERARIAQDWQRSLEADLGIARDAQNLEYYDV
ncbi:MAG: hypothetical protein IPH08_03675 [Rhodocyclaceae bacterium]|nr:hypothetical protein [Rhodocyclaceae bacterium]MBK6906252.1 hypothetical protein [Rhodocyclaceae bacterium]